MPLTRSRATVRPSSSRCFVRRPTASSRDRASAWRSSPTSPRRPPISQPPPGDASALRLMAANCAHKRAQSCVKQTSRCHQPPCAHIVSYGAPVSGNRRVRPSWRPCARHAAAQPRPQTATEGKESKGVGMRKRGEFLGGVGSLTRIWCRSAAWRTCSSSFSLVRRAVASLSD